MPLRMILSFLTIQRSLAVLMSREEWTFLVDPIERFAIARLFFSWERTELTSVEKSLLFPELLELFEFPELLGILILFEFSELLITLLEHPTTMKKKKTKRNG